MSISMVIMVFIFLDWWECLDNSSCLLEMEDLTFKRFVFFVIDYFRLSTENSYYFFFGVVIIFF